MKCEGLLAAGVNQDAGVLSRNESVTGEADAVLRAGCDSIARMEFALPYLEYTQFSQACVVPAEAGVGADLFDVSREDMAGSSKGLLH